jgi:hypothetical protein
VKIGAHRIREHQALFVLVALDQDVEGLASDDDVSHVLAPDKTEFTRVSESKPRAHLQALVVLQ